MKTLFKPIAVIFALAITTSFANADIRINAGFAGIKFTTGAPQKVKALRKAETGHLVGRSRIGGGVRQPSAPRGTRYVRFPGSRSVF